jgi:hypothetical protein
VRRAPIGIFAALTLWISGARADRLAVVPLESADRQPPVALADQLAADLIRRGHRVVAGADVAARLAMGNQGAGRDWAAELQKDIDAARSALTRLDRVFAGNVARKVGNELVHSGGGAGGPEVLVAWALLERQLSLMSSDANQASQWLDMAIAFGPNVQLDPLRHPDVERDAFTRRRVALQNQPAGRLSITSTPSAAEVWVDGVRRCESPCTVAVVPGRHWARISSPAHAPAAIEVQIPAGTTASRHVGLSAAYSGASLHAIAAMLADPSRRAEGASALEPMARFLDVEHVVAVIPWGDQTRFVVAPSPTGQPALGPITAPADLSNAVAERLRQASTLRRETSHAWYASPTTWLIAGGVAALAVGGFLIFSPSDPARTGTLTVTSPLWSRP